MLSTSRREEQNASFSLRYLLQQHTVLSSHRHSKLNRTSHTQFLIATINLLRKLRLVRMSVLMHLLHERCTIHLLNNPPLLRRWRLLARLGIWLKRIISVEPSILPFGWFWRAQR